jgi:photosystem II stability/assembly factor-like uncharacterized protein
MRVPFVAVPLLASAALVSQQPAPHWEVQTSGVTARLRGVSAASHLVVWASGTGGTIVHTTDGGATWAKQTIEGTDKLDFRDVDAVSDQSAYVLSIGPGEASRIYRTVDAGQTWSLQFTNQDAKAFFDAMAFWDADHGLALSDSVDGAFVIIRTGDGGKSWTRIPPGRLPPALPNEGGFAASGTNITVLPGGRAWVGTGAATKARVLRTSDGGDTWSIAETPVASSASAGIFSIVFLDPRRGIVVGGDYKKEGEAIDNAAVTTDGGVTWTKVTGLHGFRSAVLRMPNTRNVIAIGPSGADLSADAGRTWTALEGSGAHAFAPSPTGRVGWAVGENGRIAKLAW